MSIIYVDIINLKHIPLYFVVILVNNKKLHNKYITFQFLPNFGMWIFSPMS